MQHKTYTPVQAMRQNCLQCSEYRKDVANCPATDCPLYEYRMGRGPKEGTPRRTPLKAIRAYCKYCTLDNGKYIAFCPCDGLNSTRCHLWPYRFGKRPASAAKRYHPAYITPELMPSSNICLDDLPQVARGKSPMLLLQEKNFKKEQAEALSQEQEESRKD